MNYKVGPIREAGLQARWVKQSDGSPIISGSKDGRRWFVIDRYMWERAQVVGILKAFDEHTPLGDFFSIKA